MSDTRSGSQRAPTQAASPGPTDTTAGTNIPAAASGELSPPDSDTADAAITATPPNEPLYRIEALQARRNQWLGTVMLVPHRTHALFAGLAVVAVLALLALLALGEFTRKAKVNGWLVPRDGMVRVMAPQPGVVDALQVQEGASVRRGDPLVVLSTERQSAFAGATEAEISRLLGARRNSLQGEIDQQEQLLAQQRAGLGRRIQAIREEMAQFDAEIKVQESRNRLATQAADRMRDLAKVGFASRMQVQQQEENELEQSARLRALVRTRAERQRELVTLQTEVDDLPFRTKSQVATLNRDIAELEQQQAESAARRQQVITAPQSGLVTGLQVDLGSTTSTSTPLLSIVPEGSPLEAHLFTPSRAIGFVRPGQQVLLRYQAFPYQKFGHAVGTVASISRSAIAPGELPSHLAGMSSLVEGTEPVYRITVRLQQQQVTAYGQAHALQPGMQFDADVLLETRKLYEWLLEPLFTLTGRL